MKPEDSVKIASEQLFYSLNATAVVVLVGNKENGFIIHTTGDTIACSGLLASASYALTSKIGEMMKK